VTEEKRAYRSLLSPNLNLIFFPHLNPGAIGDGGKTRLPQPLFS